MITLKECYTELNKLIIPERYELESPLESLKKLIFNRINILKEKK